jgi:sporulation protein YlmC with PRC-barrel domain
MPSDLHLCYLDANHVETPLPDFAAADVLDKGGRKLGSVDGVIVDPAQRKAVYLVIRRSGLVRTERRLLPLADIQVEAAGRVLRVDRDPAALEEFEEHRYPEFSDDDLLRALFPDRAA